MKLLYLLMVCMLLAGIVCAQSPVPGSLQQRIEQVRNRTGARIDNSLFQRAPASVQSRTGITSLIVDQHRLDDIVKQSPSYLSIQLPSADGSHYQAELIPIKVWADDVVIRTGDEQGIEASPIWGKFYYGLLDNNPDTRVSVSIINDRIKVGYMTSDRQIWEINPVEGGDASRYQLSIPLPHEVENINCGSSGDLVPYSAEEITGRLPIKSGATGRKLEDIVVQIHVEVNYPFVEELGGIPQTINHTAGLFAQVFTLFEMEGIHMEISELVIWDKNSPYDADGDYFKALYAFQDSPTGGGFKGDLAILLYSNKTKGGLAEGTEGLCHPDINQRMCVAGAESDYALYPQFSMIVLFAAHELGHLLGSHHTHDCVWNGDGTTIDGCAPSDGPCSDGPLPGAGGGTVMSYCHNVPSVGVDLANGFGVQPGNVIRHQVHSSYCLKDLSDEGTSATYCSGSGLHSTDPNDSSNKVFIDRFQLGAGPKITGDDGGYGDHTDEVLTVKQDSYVYFRIHFNAKRPALEGKGYRGLYVWIDLNNDNDFNDTDELILNPVLDGDSVYKETQVYIPKVKEGTFRLRVLYTLDEENTGPCNLSGLGEVEDYTIIIEQKYGIGTCSVPGNIHVDLLSKTAASIDFDPEEDSWSYTVKYFEKSEGYRNSQTVTSDELPIVLEELKAGTEYQFEVRNNCESDGSSGYSQPHFFTTEGCYPGQLSITQSGNKYVPSWPIREGSHVRLLRYRKLFGDTEWVYVWDPSPGNPNLISGLDPDHPYVAQIGSLCMDGTDTLSMHFGDLVPLPYNYKYEVDFYIRDEWNTGVTVDVTVTNLTGQALQGWYTILQLENVEVYYIWAAQVVSTGPYVFQYLGYNYSIPSGGSVQYGFNATKAGDEEIILPPWALVNSQPARLTVRRKNYPIVVRARGTQGGEAMRVTVGNQTVNTFYLSTSFAEYKISTDLEGGINVHFDNDASGRDIQVDYVKVSDRILQAEDQSVNTAVYVSNQGCGNGSYSEWMHCNGFIGFLGYTASARRALITEESSENSLVRFYPNPAHAFMTIEKKAKGPVALSFYRTDGTVLEQKVITESTQISMRQLAPGLYFLKVENEEGRFVHKVIKY